MNIRKNSITSILEWDKNYLHGAEWWNGEGVDFELVSMGKPPVNFSLHLEEAHAIAVMLIAMGMVDLDEVLADVSRLKGTDLS